MDKMRIVIVDDHAVVRLGLITLLADIPWIEVVAEAGTAAKAIRAVADHRPDVVVMDIRLPEESGLVACQEITRQWPDTRVILLTSYANDELILQARQARACGYVLKQVGNQALVDALNAVRQGEAYLDPAETRQSISSYRRSEKVRHGTVFQDLTDREMVILGQIAEGQANPQIAEGLSVSEQTLNKDISSILDKLGVSNRFTAAIIAVRHNINYYLSLDK